MQSSSWLELAKLSTNMEPPKRVFTHKICIEKESDAMESAHLGSILEYAKQGKVSDLEALLRDGVSPNVIDSQGKSPLHLALEPECSCNSCLEAASACLLLLLTSNGLNANLQDGEGNTPLHIAVKNNLTKCVEHLISYGADINLRNDEGKNPLQLMGEKMPRSLVYLLNESIHIDEFDPHHEKCAVKVDFNPVTGLQNCQKGKSGCSLNPDETESETKLLMYYIENCKYSQEQILLHPVIEIFLYLKWMKIRKMFWVTFTCYILWVLTYTSYVLQVYLFSCPCTLFRKRDNGSGEVSSNGSSGPVKDTAGDSLSPSISITKCTIETGANFNVIIIIASSLFFILLELGRFIVTPRLYLKGWLNAVNWILLIFVLASTMPNLRSQKEISSTQYQLAAFTVFLAWVMVLPQIGRMPKLSKYVEIFGHILKCFGKFMLTFTPLFMGFILAFNILFFGENGSPFSNFFSSSVKVFVMMVGEMDYVGMFYGETNWPALGHLLYAAFVILICIIFTSTFVGITVSDVQMLERKAELSRIRRLIIEIFHLESTVFSKTVPCTMRNCFSKIFCVNKDTFSFHPNDPNESSIPPNLSREVLQFLESSHKAIKSYKCSKDGK